MQSYEHRESTAIELQRLQIEVLAGFQETVLQGANDLRKRFLKVAEGPV